MSELNRPRGKCPVCGKEVILNNRDGVTFCSNRCASNLRYVRRRYGGVVNLKEQAEILKQLNELGK